jgi:methionyl-tRNA formyltransferase
VRALGAGRTKINGVDVKILSTKLNNGKLEILQLQPAGKKPMDWKSFVNGLRGAKINIGV